MPQYILIRTDIQRKIHVHSPKHADRKPNVLEPENMPNAKTQPLVFQHVGALSICFVTIARDFQAIFHGRPPPQILTFQHCSVSPVTVPMWIMLQAKSSYMIEFLSFSEALL